MGCLGAIALAVLVGACVLVAVVGFPVAVVMVLLFILMAIWNKGERAR